MKKNSIHYKYGHGKESVFQLLMCWDRKSICIDKDPIAEALLRVTLAHHNADPFTGMSIHCWTVETEHKIHWFFIDDEQNDLVKQGFITACPVEVEPETILC